jgi:peptidoglycan/LPS O-acetylase OafA/YrhL
VANFDKNRIMIQRIQSLFLLLAGAGAFSLFALPFATTQDSVASSPLLNDAVFNLQDNVILLILFVLGGALSLGAIFLFKNRKLQMRLARISFIANLLGMVVVAFLYLNDAVNQANVDPKDGIGAYMPIISMILLFLAIRYIKKDDTLVKSMDRLR